MKYNRIIRKLVVGFGNLFDKITLVRYNPDQSEAERFIVPIAYAAKELYVQRLEGDLGLDKKVQMTLPRMSFEMVGLSYDASRKQNTNFKQFVTSGAGTALSQYNPVPYNFDFNLYIYVRNIEDGTQIIEHILPYFTPDYTIKLNLVPDMGIVKEIPVVLNSTTHETTYEGPRDSDPRMIVWTLNFTVKGYIFGEASAVNTITTSITNIYNYINPSDSVIFNVGSSGVGTYQTGEIVYQGYSVNTATATGKVTFWDTNNLKLTLTNINGNFVSNQPIIGLNTNANYLFNNYEVSTLEYAKIVATPSYGNLPEDLVTEAGTEDLSIEISSGEDLLTANNLNTNVYTYITTTIETNS
jgi:hypothetical protein